MIRWSVTLTGFTIPTGVRWTIPWHVFSERYLTGGQFWPTILSRAQICAPHSCKIFFLSHDFRFEKTIFQIISAQHWLAASLRGWQKGVCKSFSTHKSVLRHLRMTSLITTKSWKVFDNGSMIPFIEVSTAVNWPKIAQRITPETGTKFWWWLLKISVLDSIGMSCKHHILTRTWGTCLILHLRARRGGGRRGQ